MTAFLPGLAAGWGPASSERWDKRRLRPGTQDAEPQVVGLTLQPDFFTPARAGLGNALISLTGCSASLDEEHCDYMDHDPDNDDWHNKMAREQFPTSIHNVGNKHKQRGEDGSLTLMRPNNDAWSDYQRHEQSADW